MRLGWEQAFKSFADSGVRIFLHSCAFFKFTEPEIKSVKAFLEEYNPHLISTRDSNTFDIIKDWIPNVPKYNGIDAGFFVNKVVPPFKANKQFKYIVSNFDRYPEPEISKNSRNSSLIKSQTLKYRGDNLFVHVPLFLDYFAHKSKIWSYIGNIFDRRDLPEKFGQYTIVRPEHRFFPHVTTKIYRQKNSFSSDEPWTYLNVYANTEFTLSDRVHACVATLAYGKPAMLFTPSPRRALFERIGVGDVFNKIITLDLDVLNQEQANQIDWLKQHL
jgi:hypothetical protein